MMSALHPWPTNLRFENAFDKQLQVCFHCCHTLTSMSAATTQQKKMWPEPKKSKTARMSNSAIPVQKSSVQHSHHNLSCRLVECVAAIVARVLAVFSIKLAVTIAL